MPLLILFAVSAVAGATAATVAWKVHDRPRPSLKAARRAGAGTPRRRRIGRWIAHHMDARAATGLGLTLALAVMIVGGVVLGILAYLVRSDSGLVRLDAGIARWGDLHSDGISAAVIEAVTDAGGPQTVLAAAAVFALGWLAWKRHAGGVLFLICVMAGTSLLTTTIKELADRVRPELNPIAETLGPSFPSGHSSYTAAFLAAAALLLGRGRSRPVRAALAGAAVALTVAVASSRVLLDEHWFSDVVAGVLLGWTWFAVCSIAFGGRLLRFGAGARAAVPPSSRAPQRSAASG